jgi:hypothetical protein
MHAFTRFHAALMPKKEQNLTGTGDAAVKMVAGKTKVEQLIRVPQVVIAHNGLAVPKIKGTFPPCARLRGIK